MITIHNNKNTFFAITAFGLIQLVIYFTNRSQILYISAGFYNSFYQLLFICLFPLGFVFGSLFNQFFINRFGINGTYIVLFSITCIALLSNNLYETQWSWIFFRFIYSFCIAGLYWIFNDHLSIKNQNLSQNISYSFLKLIIIRFTNIFSNVIISVMNYNYHNITIISVLLLQFSQIFFSLNNKNNLTLAKPINELKFFIDIYFNLYQQNKIFCLFFLLFMSIHSTYHLWLIIIISHLKYLNFIYKYLIITFALGEIFSTYIFLKEDDSIIINKRIFYGVSLFSLLNFILFLCLASENYAILLPIIFVTGIIMSKINTDIELFVFNNQKVTNKINFDFSNTVVKNIFNIIILIITFHITSYKAYMIFAIVTIIYGIFILFFYKKSIKLVE